MATKRRLAGHDRSGSHLRASTDAWPLAANASRVSLATFTFMSNVTPFGIQSSTQFLPPPPPTLTSQRYATDFNEVKSLGLATSAVRTPEQTEMALRIAAVGFNLHQPSRSSGWPKMLR
jgi:hypothetical protein